MREICTSGSVGGEGGNILAYPANGLVAGAETVEIVERNTNDAAMRGIVVLPGSKSTSRVEGMHWKLGDPASDQWHEYALVRIGKVRSRSR